MKLKGLRLVTVDSQSLRVLVMTNLIGHLLIVKDIHCVKVRLSYIGSDVTGQYLPDDVNVTLRTGNNTAWHMHLRHVKYKSRDIPLYTVHVSEDGERVHKRLDVQIRENTGFYRDQSQLSLVKVTRTNDVMDTMAVLKLKGQIFLTSSLYYLTPSTRDSRVATSGSVTSDDDLYVLKLIKAPPFTNMSETVVHNSVRTTVPFPDTPNYVAARRPVREASETYRVDVAAMVDHFGYQQFYKLDGRWALQSLLEYTAFVMAEVDEIYQTIRSTAFKIRVSLKRVIVMKSAGSSPFIEQHIEPGSSNILNATTSLNAFIDYIVGEGKAIIGKHDHVMLFSGCDLASFVNGTMDQDISGLAYTSTLCQTSGRSSSIVEIVRENYASVTAAHELGHSLGAAHDGEGNICRFQDRYVMAAAKAKETPETMLNPWQFSSCSIEYFKTYLTSAISTPTVRDCLITSLAIDRSVSNVTGRFPGQDLSLDKQCERSYGTGAYFCRTKDMVYADLCRTNTCYKPSTGSCVPMPVARGTSCGNGKLCIRGNCVKHEKAPLVVETCVFGDSTGLVNSNMKCAEYINVNVAACYDSEFLIYCCDVCKQRYWGVKGCEYGDKQQGCKTAHCSVGSNTRACCRTCDPEALPGGERKNKTKGAPVPEERFQPGARPPESGMNALFHLVYIVPIMINIIGMSFNFCYLRRSRRKTLAAALIVKQVVEYLNEEDDFDQEDEKDKEDEVEEEEPTEQNVI